MDDHTLDRLAEALEARRPKVGGNSSRDTWINRVVTWVIAVLLAWATLQTDVAVLKSRVDGQDKLLLEVREDVKTLLRRSVQ